MRRFLFACAIVLPAAIAQAGPVDDARLDYIAGNYEKAIVVLMPAAVSGDPNAQNIMGAAFDDGNGVTQNHARALEWWEKAAAQNFSKALFNLGEFWLNGRPGFPADFAKALPLFERAAEQDNADAIGNLGFMYELGLGVDADPETAFKLYERASALGAVFAKSNLAALYAQGSGVEKDLAKAYALMVEAASKGDAISFSNLGVMYEQGLHVTQDKIAAFALYKQAMQRGHARAANNLASMMLEDGYGWSDPVEALAHCLWSRDRAQSPESYADFEIDCDALGAEMTAEQREAADARMSEL